VLKFPSQGDVKRDAERQLGNETAGRRLRTPGSGRRKGTLSTLPDLRALTLKALMRAGGVDYLVKYAELEPHAFFGLLGKVMPREVHTELTADVRIRQEVRRDLVEKLIVLMRTQPAANDDNTYAVPEPLPAITHNPDALLKAQASQDRESDSRRADNARREGIAAVSSILQRAEAMHLETARAKQAAETECESGSSEHGA
jgi:hypothetical protein